MSDDARDEEVSTEFGKAMCVEDVSSDSLKLFLDAHILEGGANGPKLTNLTGSWEAALLLATLYSNASGR